MSTHSRGRFEAAGVFALLCVYLAFYLPLDLYFNNQAFIRTPGIRVIALALLATLASVTLAVGIAALPGSRSRRTLAGLALGIFAVAFVHDILPLGTDQTLDGTRLVFEIPKAQLHASGVFSILLALSSILLYVRSPRARAAAHFCCTGLAIALLATPLLRAAMGAPLQPPARTEALADIVKLSPEQNILLILMDSMRGDVVRDILEQDATLRDRFRGFVLFADNLGVASTTYLTMPAMLAGTVYDGRSPIDDFFRAHVASNSFLTDLANRGWQVTHVNPMLQTCEADIAACVFSRNILLADWTAAQLDYAKLLDLGFMNAAPYPMKRWVYNRGRYRVSRALGSSGDRAFLGETVRFLRQFTEGLELGAQQPTLKLLHLMNTHPPFGLDSNCKQHRPTHAAADYREQVICGLRLFVGLLERLDALGVGEQTTAILLSDTGVTGGHQRAHLRARDAGVIESQAKLMANANPVLLVRRPGNRAPYRVSEAEVSVVDIPATVCGLAGGCDANYGPSIFDRKPGEARRRRFVAYAWTNDSWNRKRLSQVELHEIQGPAHRPESWTLIERIPDGDEP